jgi:integrase
MMKLDELLSKTTSRMMVENYALDTIDSYALAIKSFFGYLASRPDVIEMDHTKRMESFLTWRVVENDISPSTQNVEFSALLYLGRSVLGVEIGKVDALRARRRERIPHIINASQVSLLLNALPEEYKLIAQILYGAGLRINECLNLRLKDVDFSTKKLIIHEGKGDKDGIVPMPSTLVDDIQLQADAALKVWENDRYHKYNGVHVPGALARKYPNAPLSKDWFWLFPNPSLGYDHDGVQRRFHVYDFSVQKAFVITRRKLGLPEFVSPHAMRHFFATHFLQHLLEQGIPESMARHTLMGYLRHASPETMDWYVHLAMPENVMIKSPVDLLELSNTVG